MIIGVRSVAGVAVALSLWACSQTQEPAASKPPVTPGTCCRPASAAVHRTD